MMEAIPTSNDWKDTILNRIKHRNRVQTTTFQDLVAAHSRLFEYQSVLRQENENLIRERGSGGDGTNRAAEQKISMLEAKLLAQQEELTELHRTRGENMHMVVDLNKQLKEKEILLKQLEKNLTEVVSRNALLNKEIQKLSMEKADLHNVNQLIRDEHTALQLTYSQVEEKIKKLQEENTQLVDRLMRYKTKDAEKMNEENDNFLKKRNAKIQKELEEAAKESSKAVPLEPYIPESPIPEKSGVPTKVAFHFDAHDGEISAVKWSPAADKILATGGTDRKVKLWDTSKGMPEPKGILVGSNAGVMSVNFDTNGSFILGASNDFATRVWGVIDQRLKHTLTGHSGKVLAAKFLGEPTKVVTGSHDRTLKLWDLRSRACIETKFAGSCCNDVVISDSAGTTIISGHFDKKIRFWDTRTDGNINEIVVQGKVTSLDLSRDTKTLLACVRDDTLRLIDLRVNQILSSFSAENFKVACDWTRAVFSNTADYVGVGSTDGGVYVWNTNTCELDSVLKHHTCPVIAVSWHPFANYIASVDKSKKAVVWADL